MLLLPQPFAPLPFRLSGAAVVPGLLLADIDPVPVYELLSPKVFKPELKEELRLDVAGKFEVDKLELVLPGLPPFLLVSWACAIILFAR